MKQMMLVITIATITTILAGFIGIASANNYVLCENYQTKQVIVLPQGSYCPYGWRQVF